MSRACLACTDLALRRIDGCEGNEDVAVRRREFCNLFVAIPPVSRLALAIDGKNHGTDVMRPVMCRSFFDGRRMLPRGAEVSCQRGLKIIIAIVRMAAAGLLGMGVKVDGLHFVEIEHVRTLHIGGGWTGEQLWTTLSV